MKVKSDKTNQDIVNIVKETREWAVRTHNTKNGKDYGYLKKKLPVQNDYDRAKTLYYWFSYNNVNTWELYKLKKPNSEFETYIH
jgi:Ni/Co efflux regulator RcnB